MKKRFYRRCFGVLGIFAMLGALVTLPLTSTYTLAMATAHQAAPGDMAKSDAMPCHKPAQQKSCPDCPQKVCPEIGTCLVKCFQQLVPPPASGVHLEMAVAARLSPIADDVVASSLVAPLLRPPSV
ncbi:MAG: hypothetical protein WC807_09160 [Hyphomicrobium sp.]|uniref:hypothetical protein n=1 Tax=Hyphomicrobium sp. DMF-1 TaxID=3019544 RepID=UPI001ACB588E|nr:hypothetical protein [Hyphomicrobium sp. DMF-1]MBN8913056.1 hypothetical protein [Hyphomicrobiales bacterium]WBT37947.1 hypothetical protein PE058_20165 [Hyphomicrobium sp. DMF-1]